jgi:hypothetical protein
MEPLNKKERTKFLIKFSFAFLIGILIIMIPFYFLIQLPEIENDLMNKDYKKIQERVKFQKETFAVDVASARTIFDKYDVPNQDIDKLNADLGLLISRMEESYANDTTWSGRMYQDVVKSFIDLKKAKNDMIKGNKDLNDCKKDLEKAKADASKGKDTMGGT